MLNPVVFRSLLVLCCIGSSLELFGQIATTTTLTGSPNPSVLGRAVTLTATVTPGATGKVTFYEGVTVLGTSTISTGQSVLTTVILPAGSGRLHAHYLGDGAYNPSDSAVVTQTVAAQPSGALHSAFDSQISATGLLVGDFDGDGKQDLFVYNGSTAYIFLGNGDGTFQAPLSLYVGSSPQAAAVGDFDGDGKPDLAVVPFGTSNVSVYLGNGDGTFGAPATYSLPNSARSISVADFNGDGRADLAFAFDGQIGIMLGKGDGTFQPEATISANSGAILAVADFNGDGFADIVNAGAGSTYNISVMLGNGDGSFRAAIATSISESPMYIAVGDFNGDGKPDVAAADQGNAFTVILGKGDGTFGSPALYFANLVGGGRTSSLIVADANGDGKQDVITTTGNFINFNYLSILLGNGDGAFENPQGGYPIPGQAIPVALAGDFNGDGITDFAVNDGFGFMTFQGGAIPDLSVSIGHSVGLIKGEVGATYTIGVANVGQVSVTGAVSLAATIPAGLTVTGISGSGWTCAIGTLTCTRADSLSAGASYPNIAIVVNISEGFSGYAVVTATVSNASDMNPANNTATSSVYIRTTVPVSLTSSPNPSILGQPVSLTANIDPSATGQVSFYDGTSFLGVASISSGHATLITDLLPSGARSLTVEYDGDMNYAPSTSPVRIEIVNAIPNNGVFTSGSYGVGTSPVYLATGDFNLDGIPDLVTANTDNLNIVSFTVPGSVSILLGNGDGTFRPAVNYPISSQPTLVTVGDFNQDGKPDLAVGDDGVDVLLGNGDGTFQSPTTFARNTVYFTVLAAEDVNRDGIPDFIGVAVSSVATALVLIGNGDGTFQPSVETSISTTAVSSNPADLNGDGIPDLVGVEAGSSGGPILVYLGNADGTFQAPISSSTANIAPSRISLGDFNGDGKLDALITSNEGVATFAGNGDGTFQAAVPATLNFEPALAPAFPGDFNGDGKLDVAMREYVASNVIVAYGNGDGTFKTGVAFSPDGSPGNFVLADFNRDGKPDFAVLNQSTNSVNVFMSDFSLQFHPIAPCRLVDTRGLSAGFDGIGPFSGPSIPDGQMLTIPVQSAVEAGANTTPAPCGVIPSNAQAYSLNVTVVPPSNGSVDYVSIWPSGADRPYVATFDDPEGLIVSNAAIVPAGAPAGGISVYNAGYSAADVIIDMNGYFTPPSAGLQFYPVAPCRLADTRGISAGFNGIQPFAGPSIAGGSTLTLPVQSAAEGSADTSPAPCGTIPSTAQAYSFNLTVVPQSGDAVDYVSMWPAGTPQPFVSTLNDPEGLIVSNAAIVPAGSPAGGISVYNAGPAAADIVLDMNGYFAPPSTGLQFYPVAPCRLVDTRGASAGFNGLAPFSGPSIAPGSTITIPVQSTAEASADTTPAPCGAIPSTAQAYSVNLTVAPHNSGSVDYVTIWPAGSPQPIVSTLNDPEGLIVANAAIVPAGMPSGGMSVFNAGPSATDVIIDMNGYFAPPSN